MLWFHYKCHIICIYFILYSDADKSVSERFTTSGCYIKSCLSDDLQPDKHSDLSISPNNQSALPDYQKYLKRWVSFSQTLITLDIYGPLSNCVRRHMPWQPLVVRIKQFLIHSLEDSWGRITQSNYLRSVCVCVCVGGWFLNLTRC